ncbi:MAG: CpsD/CapB family tyrosine-protein kinase, partial [Caldilineaceae bacterium]|nr:CpsD/CapB family tyrosine-protein kinase [Caldilineaceae bacterium]
MTKLITLTEPHSAAAEAYQSLRTNIEFSRLDTPLQTVLVTTADGDTDKSAALANLAVVMARTGDRVIVVDGDLRRPQQHEIFGVPNQGGLSSYLQGEGKATLQSGGVDGLQIMTAGPASANPVALLSSKRLAELLDELKAQADYVLVDAPPVLAVTDAALWANQVDGVLLVVNAGGTKRDHAQRAKAVLQKVRANILGVVLLNVEKNTAVCSAQPSPGVSGQGSQASPRPS